MNAWIRLLYGSNERIQQRNIFWNVLGSAIYALTGMLLGAAVTRILGADEGGIFFFAFSTFGQQMFIAAYFGMRPIQITDSAGRFSFGDYLAFRNLTCGLSILAAGGYTVLVGDTGREKIILILLVLYKIMDGWADCWDSEFQRQGRLYLTGKSNAFRTLLSVGIFAAAMIATKDLLLSSAAAVIGQALAILLFCILPLGAMEHCDRTVHKGTGALLFKESKWLFLSAFLDLYIFAASKYAVNAYMTHADNSYYTTIFIPTSVINLMANFVIRPVLTILSDDMEHGRRKAFLKTVGRISGLILFLTLLGMGAAALFGIPVLSVLVGPEAGKELLPYRAALITVILGGGFYAVLNLFYYVLVILKAERAIFVIYALTAGLAWQLSGRMVQSAGINGAALSYTAAMLVLSLLFFGTAAYYFRRKTGSDE